ncbi:MAG: RES domain-containing protein [Rhizobiales bacterium]|nr:RES domain-containing protein [Hyphomicrobiales bacterium]
MPEAVATQDPTPGGLTLWRAFVPRWAYLPLSGKGAARFGGRWNPVGEPTVYAARELSTAWAEYNQGFVQHPALIAQLELTGADLADLTDPATLAAFGAAPEIQKCEWRALLDEGVTPGTHLLRTKLVEAGKDGVVYPSFMSPGGTCVALWRWNGEGGPRLRIVDPDDRLPRTPASWL